MTGPPVVRLVVGLLFLGINFYFFGLLLLRLL